MYSSYYLSDDNDNTVEVKKYATQIDLNKAKEKCSQLRKHKHFLKPQGGLPDIKKVRSPGNEVVRSVDNFTNK